MSVSPKFPPKPSSCFCYTLQVYQQASRRHPSVVCCQHQLETVDFEREQLDHLFTELQLRLHSSCCLRMVLAVLGYTPETAG